MSSVHSKGRDDQDNDHVWRGHPTRRLVYLSAYSLTGAALIGSSIGMIVFQSLQSYYLKRLSSTTMPNGDGFVEYTTEYASHTNGDSSEMMGIPSVSLDLLQISTTISAVAMATARMAHGFWSTLVAAATAGVLSPIPPSSSPSSSSSPSLLPPSLSSPLSPFSSSSSSASISTLRHFGSFLLIMWLPLTVWLLSVITCTLWIKYQKVIPRTLSPRMGILLSQGLFALFWIIVGAIQELQERLAFAYDAFSSGRRTSPWMGEEVEEGGLFAPSMYSRYHGAEVIATAPTMLDSRIYHPHRPMMDWMALGGDHSLLEDPQSSCILSLLTPLCAVRYLAIVLLGIATALLTTGSATLEAQLEEEYCDIQREQHQLQHPSQPLQEKVCLLMIDDENENENENGNEKEKEKKGEMEQTTATSSAALRPPTKSRLGFELEPRPSPWSWSWSGSTMLRRQLTLTQRTMIWLWVLALFSSQMWFFQWIVTHGSLPNLSGSEDIETSIEGSLVSTCLIMFGLFSGAAMIILGVRLL
ncbi:MAG: hypothetical protein J3Q66DRAFT_396127 [Benniella sp.]|nr:MAG: hypothetical protein J3Q66DRAFT_396127 [Benniella sp.]